MSTEDKVVQKWATFFYVYWQAEELFELWDTINYIGNNIINFCRQPNFSRYFFGDFEKFFIL